jgi:hypothetical protein
MLETMKTNSLNLLFIATFLSSGQTILGMDTNTLSPMVKTLQLASLNRAGRQTYYNVAGFKKAFHDNADKITAKDLYDAYIATTKSLTNIAAEYAICNRDYAAAFIAYNAKSPGSFQPEFIQLCQQSTYRENHGNALLLHIASHRWGEQTECKNPEHADYNWPSMTNTNTNN